jgi:hypothetical protein
MEVMTVDFSRLNLNSAQRKSLWQKQQGRVNTLLEQIKTEAFDGEASIKSDYVTRFSGLAQPNLALRPTTDLAGFIAVCVSPQDPEQLRVIASNGHTAARTDGPPQEMEKMLASGLKRWLGQPLYRQSGAIA